MRRIMYCGIFALTGLSFVATAATAIALRVAAPPPGPARMKLADAVVVGRVVAFNNKDVKVQNATYRVALVAVSDLIKGKGEQRMLRVGFIPYKRPFIKPGQPVRPFISSGGRQPQLAIGQHGLFYLKKHPKADFYIAPMYYDFVASTNQANFKQELTFAKFTQKYGDHPEKAMDSKDASVRYTAAVVMLQNFRRPTGRPPYKRVAVDAKLSMQILTEIRNGDWTRNDQWAPMNMFYRLGVSAQDGFQNPRPIRGQPAQVYNERRKAAIQTWLAKNMNTYRVKKYVGGKGKGPIRPLPPNVRPPIRIQPVPLPQPVPGVRPLPGAPIRGVLPAIPPQAPPQPAPIRK